jgi:hypothetical protein
LLQTLRLVNRTAGSHTGATANTKLGVSDNEAVHSLPCRVANGENRGRLAKYGPDWIWARNWLQGYVLKEI